MKYFNLMMSAVLRALITAYRYVLSPVLGTNCRYEPGCSAYAQEAIHLHGPWRGSWLAAKRIMRCQPWGGAGYDPVPAARPCNHDHSSAATPTLAKHPEG
ncbi:MAG: membrane protein insertion efficiency factor YidD [Alphaproteobacteria bacterium]|nr:membrane protein insertion efficiency factor YidD [Alphaproteobacteria bacterium]